MEDTRFDYMILKDNLMESDVFGEVYTDIFKGNNSIAFNNPLKQDVNEIFTSIVIECEKLTDFQTLLLSHIFNAFNEIRLKIDPNRLKQFKYYYNNDDELLLYRETEKGLTNIIINPDECIAYSFIPNNNTDLNRVLYFVGEDGDFERLAYDFFSN